MSLRLMSGDFARLWTGSTATSLSDGIRLVAFPLLAASITRDPFSISLVSVAAFAPALLIGTFAGVLIDRVRKRDVVVVAHLGRGVILAALAILVMSNMVSLPVLCAVAFLSGTGEAFAVPASSSLVPELVHAERVGTANSRMQAGQTAAEDFVGRATGGVLFALAQPLPIVVSALLLVAAAVVVRGLGAAPAASAERTATRLVDDWREGFRTVVRSRLLSSITVLVGAWNLSYGAYTAVAVIYALKVLGTNDVGFGLLLSIGAVGSLAGSFLAIPLVARLGAPVTAVSVVVLSGASMVTLGLSSNLVAAAVLLAGDGFAIMVWNILSTTLRQTVTEPSALGRVTSITRVFATLALPTAAALAGLLARAAGVVWVLISAGSIVFIAAAILVPRLWSTLGALWPRDARQPRVPTALDASRHR